MKEDQTIRIFDEAVELAPDDRPAFLKQACGEDRGLLEGVRTLLEAWDDSGTFLTPAVEAVPKHLGRFKIEREIGRGGMGIVYLATDPELGRQIAIKSLPRGVTASPRRRETLRREARSLAALSHPNIAHLYSLEVADDPEGTVFLTMEYVRGRPLSDELRSGPLELTRALDIGRQICSALEAAHRHGIVHRDLGPMNVRITEEGWVKVLDFGLAALLADREPDSIAETTEPSSSAPPADASGDMPPLVGTPGYMSPEQIRGGKIDVRIDAWALGCVVFECLVGAPAITGTTLRQILDATEDNRIAWSGVPDSVPTDVTRALRLCLQDNIEERPKDLGVVRRVLDEQLLRIRSAPFVRRRRPAQRRSGRGNLPRNANRFIGRARVMSQLVSLVMEHPLITITGSGGTGKTRTALELGVQVLERFPDGAWFIEFSELVDPGRIIATIARTLDLEESAGHDLPSLSAALEERTMLLIFDNCEHIIAELSPIVSELLDQSDELSIVATSRESLRVPGEQSFALSALETAPPDAETVEIENSESAQLFLARARARDPRFDPSPEDTAYISEICRAVDGLPLAIEMAAGHARTVSLHELHRWVHDDPRFLNQRGSGGAQRHRSLEEMIDWSYRLLDDEERRFFEDLAIFRGGWSLAAAEAMAANDSVDIWKVRDLLERLVEKSLVEIESTGSHMRYRFLETVRQFATHRQKDTRGAESPERRQRFVTFFVEETRPRASELGRNSVAWLRRTRFDFANVLRAFEMSLEDGRLDQAYPLGSAIGRCSYQDGQWREGRELLQELIHLVPTGESGRAIDPLDRSEVFAFAAEATVLLDRFEEADEIIAAGFARLEEDSATDAVRREEARNRMLDGAGSVAYYEERMAHSYALKGQAEEFYRRTGDTGGLAAVLGDMGRIHSVEGKHELAVPYYREALHLSRELGDEISAARLLVNLGRTGQMTGQSDETLSQLREALTLLRQGGDSAALSQCLQALAHATRDLENDLVSSRVLLAEALELRHRAGLFRATASALLDFASLEVRVGNHRGACEYLASVQEAHRSRSAEIHSGLNEMIAGMKTEIATALQADDMKAAEEHGRTLGFRALVERAVGTAGGFERSSSLEDSLWDES